MDLDHYENDGSCVAQAKCHKQDFRVDYKLDREDFGANNYVSAVADSPRNVSALHVCVSLASRRYPLLFNDIHKKIYKGVIIIIRKIVMQTFITNHFMQKDIGKILTISRE